MTDRTPSRAQYIKDYVRFCMSEMRVCLPGRVEKVDHDAQTVDVQPQIKRRLQAEDGTVSYERLPVIRTVPIGYQRAGDFFSYLPPKVGDSVMLHFVDYSMDEWFDSGRESEPAFAHAHELTDCFAVPAGYPKSKALSGMNGDDAVIGKIDGSKIVLKGNGEIHAGGENPTSFVALAQHVEDALSTLKSAISSAAVTPQDGGATFKANILGALSSWPPSVAADKLKASG